MIQAVCVTVFAILPLTFALSWWMFSQVKTGEWPVLMAYAIPLAACLCAVLAIFEQLSVEQRQKKQTLDRIGYLNMMSQAVASQLRRNKPAHSVRQFVDKDLCSRDEKLYVLYTGWRESQNQPLSGPQLQQFQNKLYATRP